MFKLSKEQKISNLQEALKSNSEKITRLQKMNEDIQKKIVKIQNSPSEAVQDK
jgi:chaperonin cofactor prefoldin